MSGESSLNSDYLAKLVEAVMDKNSRIDPISQSFYDNMLKNFSILIGKLEDTNKLNKSELDSIIKLFNRIVSSDYGLKRSKEFVEAINQIKESLGKRISEGDKVGVEKLISALSQAFSVALADATKANVRGKKGPLDGVSEDNKRLKKALEDIAKRMGVLDSATDKLINFMSEENKKQDKKSERRMQEFIDALERNKFIGGALRDTFRLIGLLGANFLSKFGTFGKVLGASLYVAMEAFGPIFSKMLLEGFGKLLWKLVPFMGKSIGSLFSKGLTGLANWGPLARMGVTPLADMATAPSVGALAGSTKLALGVAGAAAVGAGFAGSQAVDSWQKGRKGNAAALGVGALALGAGAIAAVVAGLTAPITVPLLAIGATVTGIALIWKNYSKQITEFTKSVLDWISQPFKPIIDWLADHLPSWLKKDSGNDSEVVSSLDGMTLNKYGAVTNVREMNRMSASEAAKNYRKKNAEQFYQTYETVGSEHAYLGQFKNDWAIRDDSGNALEAVMARGASQNLEKMWYFLQKAGMSPEKAKLLKYTSGRATGDSTHKKGGYNSHDNFLNMVTDLGTNNRWSDEEWKLAFNTLKPILKDMGYDLKWEGVDSKGKTYFGDSFVEGLSNRHFHVGMKKDFVPEEVQEALEQREKVASEQHSIEVETIFKKLLPEEYENIKKENEDKSPEKLTEIYEKKLKEKGYEESSGGYYFDGATKLAYLSVPVDPSGNKDFSQAQLVVHNMVVNGG